MENKMSYYTSEIPKNEKFRINNCSKYDILTAPSRNIRPKGRSDFLLMYIMEGCCYLNIDKEDAKIAEKGSIILYFPKEPQDYSFNPEDKPSPYLCSLKIYDGNKHPQMLSNIIDSIRTSADQTYNAEKWAEQCGYSRAYFIQVFKKMTGMPPYQYLTKIRMKHAKELLLFTDISISRVGELCGYPDCNYFSRIFKKNEGVTPSDYRNNKNK